ncbi:MAG: choice-of-anchor Q domain-containing protein [Candidatus Sulfotelmatobacter sp.]
MFTPPKSIAGIANTCVRTASLFAIALALHLVVGNQLSALQLHPASINAALRARGWSTTGCSASASANFYVSTSGNDNNNGSESSPWRTISAAGSRVGPGSIVHVAPGTYAEAPYITVSGQPSARICFISDVRWGAKITGTPTENYGVAVMGNYFDVDGFDITNINPSGHLGIISQGSFNQIVGNRVHDVAPIGGTDGVGGAGIMIGDITKHDNNVLQNVIYNIGNFNVNWASIHNIYYENKYGLIANNISFRSQGCGIQLWHNAGHLVIANNTIFNNQLCGIVIGADDTPVGAVDDYNITVNNIVVYNGSLGAHYGIVEIGHTGTHNQYLNNLVWENVPGNFLLLNGVVDKNTVTADPGFVNYQPDGTGNYHLLPTSPAVNTGTSYGAPKTDFDDGPRPIGPAWDIGAYEEGSTPGTWPWFWILTH